MMNPMVTPKTKKDATKEGVCLDGTAHSRLVESTTYNEYGKEEFHVSWKAYILTVQFPLMSVVCAFAVVLNQHRVINVLASAPPEIVAYFQIRVAELSPHPKQIRLGGMALGITCLGSQPELVTNKAG